MDDAGALLVEYVELGFVADRLRVCVDVGEGLHHDGVLSGFHRAEENSVEFINVN